jgi:hypothetical protein
MFKKFTYIAIFSLLVFSCTNNNIILDNNLSDNLEINSIQQKNTRDNLLCVSLKNGSSEIIKTIDLRTNQQVSLPVTGTVVGMSADVENNIVYASTKSIDNYSLFKLDLNKKTVSRILSFSQLGIRPTYFVVEKNKVYVTGKKGNSGTFYLNDLEKNQWEVIANNISEGRIEPGFTNDTYHIISFDDNYVTRTIVDVKLKLIKSRKTIKHDIPFGNNIFVPSPHGLFVYVLHQLNNSFIPYVFNVKQGTYTKFEPVSTEKGLLYSAAVSPNGRELFTNVNSEIFHYQLQGDKLVQFPKIKLNNLESRNIAVSFDNLTLYVTHEIGNTISVIRFNSNYTDYTVNSINVGLPSNQIYIF